MEKDKKIKNEAVGIVNKDAQGNVINAAFPVSKRTKRDQSKTSVMYTLLAVILYVLAFLPVVIVPVVLAVKCYMLAPYYSLWHFIGVIVSIVFAIIYAVVIFAVSRKKSKSNIAMQTVKVAITFTCLTSVFALLLTYALPDLIEMATQNTLFVEDVYYNAEAQAEKNLKLDRDFVMYNLLNGNLNNHSKDDGDYSYTTLSKREEGSSGQYIKYYNSEINTNFLAYKNGYTLSSLQTRVLDKMKEEQPRKYELYEFVYNTYVLNDFDYALYNNIDRRAFALALVDYEYKHANYERLLKEGFKNKKIQQIFESNYNNYNHDGYQTFDDPLLLYAQMEGRLTTSVIVHILLNEGWTYSQVAYDENGNIQYADDGNLLFEQYNPEARDKFEAEHGVYNFKGTLLNADGKTYEESYGFNSDGWMVFKNGVVKRPIQWSVLDMDGKKMDLASVDIFGMLNNLLPQIDLDLSSLVAGLLPTLGKLVDSVGELLQDDLQDLIEFATGGANLNISICIDDDNMLDIGLMPMNTIYGFSGYANSTWVQSNNLLMAVINLVGTRNWFSIFGAVGVVLVIAAGILRECAKKTRLRTAVSRDRIIRNNTAKLIAEGEYVPDESDENSLLAEDLTLADVEDIENAQQRRAIKGKDLGNINLDGIDLDGLDLDGIDLSGIDLNNLDDINIDEINLDEINLDDIDVDDVNLDDIDLAEAEEKPKKKKASKKKKSVESEKAAEPSASDGIAEENNEISEAPQVAEATAEQVTAQPAEQPDEAEPAQTTAPVENVEPVQTTEPVQKTEPASELDGEKTEEATAEAESEPAPVAEEAHESDAPAEPIVEAEQVAEQVTAQPDAEEPVEEVAPLDEVAPVEEAAPAEAPKEEKPAKKKREKKKNKKKDDLEDLDDLSDLDGLDLDSLDDLSDLSDLDGIDISELLDDEPKSKKKKSKK
ncbi:MAG: pentapeptide repeat-containing protein [Bacteroides sp.]|nr:pentapeptide repeat-containing protein [Bacillota bacterium]MCM1393483.1 pentapeptide repeat-containing protein [[Eubacterium] siraeum]MCM1455283.1 pentapeptide repeat-containing protein [Bacteroides sp.]